MRWSKRDVWYLSLIINEIMGEDWICLWRRTGSSQLTPHVMAFCLGKIQRRRVFDSFVLVFCPHFLTAKVVACRCFNILEK